MNNGIIPTPNNPRLIDLVGSRFGYLLVVGYAGKPAKHHCWRCLCNCGSYSTVQAGHLRSGHTSSCGCQQSKAKKAANGMSGTRTYNAWCSMRYRCVNPTHDRYKNYGGRGIRFCERWHSFENFLADMGECPEKYTIERIDVNGNYTPDNCIWLPAKLQQKNRTNTRTVTYAGKTYCLADWSRITGIGISTLSWRYRQGWKPEDILR